MAGAIVRVPLTTQPEAAGVVRMELESPTAVTANASDQAGLDSPASSPKLVSDDQGPGHPLGHSGALFHSAEPVAIPEVSTLSYDTALAGIAFELDRNSRGSTGESRHVDILKRLVVDQRASGEVNLRVSAGSVISVETTGLLRIIVASGREDLAEVASGVSSNGYVKFEDLRSKGLKIIYDPKTDSLVL